MAIPKTSFHIRSISLPSTSHPLDASIEEHLRRLSASQAGPSSSSICQNLGGIKALYEQMNDLIHLPRNQQVLCHELLREEVGEVLDGSLALLDGSSSALDALSQMKRSILDLQSAMRRGNADEGIQAYLMSRRKISKMIVKYLASLKKADKSCTSAQPENDCITTRMLKEAEKVGLSTLKSVLSYLMGKSQRKGWSLVTRLVKSKAMSCEAEKDNEVEEIDRILRSLSEKQSGDKSTYCLKQLETLEMIIHELEESLESVSRCLVKTRVSLLNVLNH